MCFVAEHIAMLRPNNAHAESLVFLNLLNSELG